MNRKKRIASLLAIGLSIVILILTKSEIRSQDFQALGWEIKDYTQGLSSAQKELDKKNKERTKKLVRFEKWGGYLKEDKGIFWFNVTVALEKLFPDWTCERNENYICKRYDLTEKVQNFTLRKKFRLGENEQEIELNATITIAECESVLDAHESLINIFSNSEAFRQKTDVAGDVCFIIPSNPTCLDFARGNLRLSINCIPSLQIWPAESYWDKDRPFLLEITGIANEIAVKIDNEINKTDIEDSGDKNKPNIEEFKLKEEKTIRAKKEYEIAFRISNSNNRGIGYKIRVSGGKIFWKEEKLYFITEKPGGYKIILYVKNENSIVQSKELQFNVD